MKARLAAILSIAGVLTAGTAAAVINTRVLESDSTSASGSSVSPGPHETSTSVSATTSTTTLVPVTSSSVVATAAVPESTSLPASSAETSPVFIPPAPPPDTQAPASPAPSQATYSLGRGGSVTLDASGGVLTIVRVDPAAGWEVHDARNESPTQVRVRVRSDSGEVRLEASLVFGVVTTSLEDNGDG